MQVVKIYTPSLSDYSYGWDRHCQRDEAWVQQMNADPQLPHYYVLPDETDCQRLFGGVRLTKYVGQDNMLHVEGQTVVHRALDCYFSGYSQEQGRYIPLEKLKYEYPDDYSVGPEALRPAGEDANLLLHPELESGNARGKLSGKDATGEKQHAASLRAQSP